MRLTQGVDLSKYVARRLLVCFQEVLRDIQQVVLTPLGSDIYLGCSDGSLLRYTFVDSLGSTVRPPNMLTRATYIDLYRPSLTRC
jgi:hypothetical protein